MREIMGKLWSINIVFVFLIVACGLSSESESLNDSNGVVQGRLSYSKIVNDSCHYTVSTGEGDSQVFFYRKELYDIIFLIKSGVSEFELNDIDFEETPIFVSFKKNGPSWSYRIKSGKLIGKKDKHGDWIVSGSNLTTDENCEDSTTYSFVNQVFQ